MMLIEMIARRSVHALCSPPRAGRALPVVCRAMGLLAALLLVLGQVRTTAAQDVPDASSVAQPPPLPEDARANRSPYQIWWGFDIGFTVGIALLASLPRLYADELIEPPCVPPSAEPRTLTGAQTYCDKNELNELDRLVAGFRNKTASQLSDVGFAANLALPFVLDAIDVLVSDPVDGWAGYGRDVVIFAETLAVASAVNNTFNLVTRRPRPLVYDEDREFENRIDGNQYLSFPSGHVLVAFAMATAYNWTFTERHPDHWLVVPVWISTYALATSSGIGRVIAGEHFPTDVIVGSLVGVGIGLMIPWLHTPDDEFDTTILVPGDAPQSVDWRLTPIAFEDGAGIAITFRE